jgi:hypothetical protein
MTEASLREEALPTTTEVEVHQFCSAARATSATALFGPWSPGLRNPTERKAQLRVTRPKTGRRR